MGKNKPNAYSQFVSEHFNRLKREGKNPIKNNLFKELDPLWQKLTDAEKQKYKDRAKGYQNQSYQEFSTTPNVNSKAVIGDLIAAENKTAIKRTYDEIDWDDNNKELVAARDEKRLKQGVSNHWRARGDNPERYEDINLVRIRETCKAIIASRAKNLISMPIYSLSVNVLCLKRTEKGDIYVPIEIGICAYSLKAGRIGKPYHVLIDAGSPPDGCINLASDHAETHKITIPPKQAYPPEARKDYRTIYKEIVSYIKAGERTILVWDAREMQQVIGSLEWLYEKANQEIGPGKIPRVSTWTILPVMEFTANMANYVHMNMLGNKEPVFIIHYYIRMLLEGVNIFDYEKDLMCDYHKGIETKWCAQGCSIRMFLSIERVFEEIYKGFMIATNPEFLKKKMNAKPIMYHQHRASQQFLSAQANASSSNIQSTNQIQSSHPPELQQQQPVLALPAPNQLSNDSVEENSQNPSNNNKTFSDPK